MEKANLFDNIPGICAAEVFETLFEKEGLKVERIISHGHSTPVGQWYDQDWDEWVVLLRGASAILFEGNEAAVVLKPGDYLYIPSHRRHRVEWTDRREKTIWLAVHMKGGASGTGRKAGMAVRSEKQEEVN